MALQNARKGRLYVKKEVTYGTDPVATATNALRHINFGATYDPFQRVTSPEKKLSPGAVARFDRRTTAGVSPIEALLRPSGTINTVPEVDPILEAAFGSKINTVLATTLNDAAATVTGATLTSVVGLAVGGALVLVVAGKKYARVITNIAGSLVTWAPALPAAPANASAVKSALVYKLTTDLAVSLFVSHYLDTFKRSLPGTAIDQLTMTFDGTEEARISASGPAQQQLTATAPAQPGAFTTVGGNPPTGLLGELRVGANAYLHKKLEVSLSNSLALRNVEAGNGGLATEVYRNGRREIKVSLEAFAETEATLYDLTEAGTNASIFRQNGFTEGNIVAVYMPSVEFKPASTDDGDEAASWAFGGVALESADGANDEVTLILG